MLSVEMQKQLIAYNQQRMSEGPKAIEIGISMHSGSLIMIPIIASLNTVFAQEN